MERSYSPYFTSSTLIIKSRSCMRTSTNSGPLSRSDFSSFPSCFSLHNAVQTFRRLINNILLELDFVFAYIQLYHPISSATFRSDIQIKSGMVRFDGPIPPEKNYSCHQSLIDTTKLANLSSDAPYYDSIATRRTPPLTPCWNRTSTADGNLSIYFVHR